MNILFIKNHLEWRNEKNAANTSFYYIMGLVDNDDDEWR